MIFARSGPAGHASRLAGIAVSLVVLVGAATSAVAVPTNTKLDGYHGIWFTIGQDNAWGPKYSGGLATYTANHVPTAIYAPAVNKTFFVYGGVDAATGDLLIMASYFDHATCEVPRPVVVYHKVDVNDPHDNSALLIDRSGYLWVFVSGRAAERPGFIYRSTTPYAIGSWDYILADERTYPQPWYLDDGVNPPLFVHLFTKYTAGRELYWATSSDGVNWSPHHKMAGYGGHYQTSCERNGKIGTAFNYHPNGADSRTNLYYMQTSDGGQTWTTAGGTPLSVPLSQVNNPALLVDYEAQGLLCYINDTNFDDQGRPYINYITSHNYAAGPAGDPRVWHLARWTGQQWVFSEITTGDHNYDMGSLYVEGNILRIIAPTENGPQVYGTGGEVAQWISHDLGSSWTKVRDVTTASQYNHCYVRRPKNARDPFYAYWADGNPLERSESRLYFSNRAGTHVWRLPMTMSGEFARPERVTDFSAGATITPLWRSSFETRSAVPVVNGQTAALITNAAGLAGTSTGTTAATYAAYGQGNTGAAPSAGAGGFALFMPNSRANGISTGIRSDAGQLAQALTFEGFFKTPESAAITSPSYVGRRMVTQKQSGDGETRLCVGLHASGSSNVLAVFYKTSAGTNTMCLGTTPVLANTWYHFALACDGTVVRWYLDGAQQGEVLNADMAAPGGGIMAVGNLRLDGSSDRGFYGFLDDIRVHERALSPSEFLINGGSCGAWCQQPLSSGLVWCSGFEAVPGAAVSHNLSDTGACGAIENSAVGADGTAVGTTRVTYAAYGQPGVGQAPAAAAGGFALAFSNDRSVAINTNLPSNSGGLQAGLTFEGFFNSAETLPITAPASVGRRLVTQKRSALDTESRLAIGLQANADGTQNVLAVFWSDQNQANHVGLGVTAVPAGGWHHFALVYDGDLRWYLDGGLEGRVSAPALTPAGSAPVAIGNGRASGVSDRGFFGLIDEIRIVDRALPPKDFLLPPPDSRPEPCYPACAYPFADGDSDGDVDMADFGRFQACLGRTGSPSLPVECLCFDRDGDGAINSLDLAAFVNCYSGPSVSWAQAPAPNCVP